MNKHTPEQFPPLARRGNMVFDETDTRPGYARCVADNIASRELADLFAAAPELLEACKEAGAFLQDGYPDNEVSPLELNLRRQLRAAIALAESGKGAQG